MRWAMRRLEKDEDAAARGARWKKKIDCGDEDAVVAIREQGGS